MTCDVIGDVHGKIQFPYSHSCDYQADIGTGQFYDLLHLYSLTGRPTDKHCLLMNGDLVDRGSWSVEVILCALAFKCTCIFLPFFEGYVLNSLLGLYPKTMYINRGNHETKEMNRTYGFEGEAKHKHGEQTYKVITF